MLFSKPAFEYDTRRCCIKFAVLIARFSSIVKVLTSLACAVVFVDKFDVDTKSPVDALTKFFRALSHFTHRSVIVQWKTNHHEIRLPFIQKRLDLLPSGRSIRRGESDQRARCLCQRLPGSYPNARKSVIKPKGQGH